MRLMAVVLHSVLAGVADLGVVVGDRFERTDSRDPSRSTSLPASWTVQVVDRVDWAGLDGDIPAGVGLVGREEVDEVGVDRLDGHESRR